MSESNKSRRQIAIFLLFLLAFSAVFYFLILIGQQRVYRCPLGLDQEIHKRQA